LSRFREEMKNWQDNVHKGVTKGGGK